MTSDPTSTDPTSDGERSDDGQDSGRAEPADETWTFAGRRVLDGKRFYAWQDAPDPVWVYVCADQQTDSRIVTARVVGARDYRDRHAAARVRRSETAPGITQRWGDRWSACDLCADLIENRDLYGLISRVAGALPAKYTRGNRLARVRGELHATYTNLLETLTPGRGRITTD